MRRYWIEKKDLFQNQVNFTGDVFHHIFDVCRQEVGSKFEVLTEDSKAYFVEVTSVTKKNAQAQILEERAIPALKEPRLHLLLSISRFPVMDAVMEKAVELGVFSVQPFFSEYSFLRKGEKLSENKIERWEKIVRSASQQSGRGDLMKIQNAVHFDQIGTLINRSQGHAGLFAYEGSSVPAKDGGEIATLGIKSYVAKIKAAHPEGVRDLWIIVGSEGGFSQREVQQHTDLGLDPVTLGPQVLRVETACMALISVLKYDFDLMS